MSFDKYMGKEHRKQYYGSKAIDRTCRNHGSCGYCKSNRTYKNRKRLDKYEQLVKNFDRLKT